MKKGKRKKHKKCINISLMELLTFGIFLLALLTFVFTFCKWSYIAKNHPCTLISRWVAFAILLIGQPLVGDCSFCALNITNLVAVRKGFWKTKVSLFPLGLLFTP